MRVWTALVVALLVATSTLGSCTRSPSTQQFCDSYRAANTEARRRFDDAAKEADTASLSKKQYSAIADAYGAASRSGVPDEITEAWTAAQTFAQSQAGQAQPNGSPLPGPDGAQQYNANRAAQKTLVDWVGKNCGIAANDAKPLAVIQP